MSAAQERADAFVRGWTSDQPDRRGSSRWIPAVRCTAITTEHGPEVAFIVVDLSESGGLLRAADLAGRERFAIGSRVHVEIQMGASRHGVSAQIVRESVSEGSEFIDLGVRFEGVSPRIDLNHVKIDPSWALRVPASVALRRRLLPLCDIRGIVQVAAADMRDRSAIKALERYISLPVQPQLVDPDSLMAALRRIYSEARLPADVDGNDPVSICDEILYAAWLRRASDLHIDPERETIRIRFRVDGQLEDYRRLPLSLHPELLSRIKVLGGMDIAEKRAPQDGSFTHTLGPSTRFEIRVATLPTRHGERATLRLLSIEAVDLTLERLGMAPRDLSLLAEAIRRPHGLILATGPTGCGKTTTLTAALRRVLKARPVNAIAVQDPVEYDMPGVAQVEVDAAKKVTFANALRSILRHDPDVILIGEIRDSETLDIALKAALTGHLVLATLHTNAAASAVTRLIDMGADRYLIAATLRLVLAQRLVRRLCSYCSVKSRLRLDQAILLGDAKLEGARAFEPGSCIYCAGRGFTGRTGLFEILSVDSEIGRAIASGSDEDQIRELSRAKGVPSILDDGVEKVSSGLTALSEVLQAIA